jgi:Alw26I/Eco31I/Esp3I family type II restriction m6 adenine DNA methyltransferase
MSVLPAELLAGITDAAALRSLFVALGYDEQQKVAYTSRTLDWPDNVAVELRGRAFDLLADADDGQFQILLLPPTDEVQGLSKELTRRLYTTLEQRLVEGVLVLPDQTWGAIELVLLADTRPLDQRTTPLNDFLRFSFDPRALRPHQQIALALLNATGAGPGELSVLAAKAFRRAQQERFFRSVNVFGTYYLEQRIATDPPVRGRWAALAGEMPALRAALVGADIPAVLTSLGWSVLPSATSGLPERLAANGAEAALLATLPDGHPLDQPISATSYPQLALLAALEKEKQAGGVVWAVLTNGRQWRLYSAITASISGTFYEVDLADMLAYGGDDDLRLFAAFFGATGLATDFARVVLKSSETLAKEVGESLKKLVFSQVFALLANAIADDLKRRTLYIGDAAQLELIRRATLVLLYRILFLLYAESMRLLPTLHKEYYPHSLTFLLSEIAVHPFTPTHLQKPMGPTAFWAWEHVQALCGAVSDGRAAWGVPKYNGGLFSDGAGDENPQRAPHMLLASASLGAMDLCKALRLLGLDPATANARSVDEARQLIDYAALDVRRLGSIYEGLLEYRLAEKADGTLELLHTRDERRASASYYTPDYIVAYIVEQAVGPVLEERAKRFATVMERLPAARRELERATANEGNERISIQTAKANSDDARKRVAGLEHEAVETLLDIKILDPAMGSGHFLVEAVNFVTDRLIVILNQYQEGNPLLARLAVIKREIRASLREQGVDALIPDEQLNNVNLLRRLVMKRCVFGVDLNDMAVELARLSLWLTSFTVGAPLNFLDHHLKWGNSLIGARVQAVQQAMEGKDVGIGTQLDMFTSGSAFKEMLDLAGFIEELVGIADANAQQVEQSEQLYRAYEASVVPVKRLLDLWVSRSFGSKEANDLISLYSGNSSDVGRLKAALTGDVLLSHASQRRAIERARELFIQHRFLHWDLDFPEVFINLQAKAWRPADEAGFDAVIGNPPYDILKRGQSDTLTTQFIEFVRNWPEYKNVLSSMLNIFHLMVVRFVSLTALNRIVSQIVPLSLMSDYTAAGVRKHLMGNTELLEIQAFPQKDNSDDRVFPEAKLSTCIFVARSGSNTTNISCFVHPGKYIQPTSPKMTIFLNDVKRFDPDNLTIPMGTPEETLLLTKLYNRKTSIPMSKYVDVLVGEIDMTLDRSLAKPEKDEYELLKGAHVQRYLQREKPKQGVREWIDYAKFKVRYGNASKMLLHKQDRIVFQAITGTDDSRRLKATSVSKGFFLANSLNYFALQAPNVSQFYILALINGRFLEWRFRLTSTNNNVNNYEVLALPVPAIAFTTPAPQRTALLDEAKALYERSLAAKGTVPAGWRGWRERWATLWAWADARLPQLADGAPDTAGEQSDAVHDLLAHLAERMIALNKQKQVGAAAFTGWLEAETGSVVEEWVLKTVVQSFWEEPWEKIDRALQKNRGKFMQTQGLRGRQVDAALVPLARAARGRWETETAALAPTLAALTATDRLIDLLVYRLYGLTDEEIDLVEGL